jgi:hypothetical protein
MELDVVQGRSCGPCTQCCTTMAVGELNKPEHVACNQLGACGGCAVYDTRPDSCRAFRCMWLDGNITDESMRPDLSKVVWVFKHFAPAKAFTWHAFEAEPGALETPEIHSLIQNITRRNFVLLIHRDGHRRLLGPEYKMAGATYRMSKAATARGKSISIHSNF